MCVCVCVCVCVRVRVCVSCRLWYITSPLVLLTDVFLVGETCSYWHDLFNVFWSATKGRLHLELWMFILLSILQLCVCVCVSEITDVLQGGCRENEGNRVLVQDGRADVGELPCRAAASLKSERLWHQAAAAVVPPTTCTLATHWLKHEEKGRGHLDIPHWRWLKRSPYRSVYSKCLSGRNATKRSYWSERKKGCGYVMRGALGEKMGYSTVWGAFQGLFTLVRLVVRPCWSH